MCECVEVCVYVGREGEVEGKDGCGGSRYGYNEVCCALAGLLSSMESSTGENLFSARK